MQRFMRFSQMHYLLTQAVWNLREGFLYGEILNTKIGYVILLMAGMTVLLVRTLVTLIYLAARILSYVLLNFTMSLLYLKEVVCSCWRAILLRLLGFSN